MLQLNQDGDRVKAMRVMEDEYPLSDEMEADLAESMEEARHGEGINSDEFFARLVPMGSNSEGDR